jgi:TolB-like protein/DNA-binding winged helix-turn-helix (wHTH) protein/tetratricopeptide (TPR) repeat protein
VQRDFRLGEWTVRSRRHILENGSDSKRVTPKSMAVLECLAAAAGEPVSRGDLFDAVWPGGEVSDDTLTQCVAELRKAFGDSARKSQVIETIHKVGFRLLPVVEPLEDAAAEKHGKGIAEALETPVLTGKSARYTQSQSEQPVRMSRVKAASFVVVGLLAVGAILMTMDKPRIWLTQGAMELALHAAALISSNELDVQLGIAVLPFTNMSSDPENEYFSDGMSEEILDALVKTNRMPVIARTSSFQFKGKNQDIREIGQQLGVTHVLEGSVRKAGSRVRISAQLIDSKTGAHIWSDTYERELLDVFALQDEIATTITTQIGSAIDPGLEQPIDKQGSRGTASAEAYDLYLRARHFASIDNPHQVEMAIPLYKQALALDDRYADAWVGLAGSYTSLASYGLYIPSETYPLVIDSAKKALKVNPNHAGALALLGNAIARLEFKWNEGMALMARAVALRPEDAGLLAAYGHYLLATRQVQAVSVLNKAYRLNPRAPLVTLSKIGLLMELGRGLDAVAILQSFAVTNQQGYFSNVLNGVLAAFTGHASVIEKAIENLNKLVGSDDPAVQVLELMKLQMIENNVEAAERLRRDLIVQSQYRPIPFHTMFVFDEDQANEMWTNQLKLRSNDISALFGPKPIYMADKNWQRIRTLANVSEVQIGSLASGLIRTEDELNDLISQAATLPDDVMNLYIGDYKERERGWIIRVSRKNNQLTLILRDGQPYAYIPDSSNNQRFHGLELKGVLEFNIVQGKITGLALEQRGITFILDKIGD